jgi:dihydrofolate reductase
VISLIAALSRNRVIGVNGGLPWRLPDDSKHFRRTTMGKPVIMGRINWESLPKPLDGRDNIVVTRQRDYEASGCTVVHSIEDALEVAKDADEIMIIGGQDIYAATLPLADRMVLTFVDAEVEGDTYFPEFDAGYWREVERHEHAADDRHAYAFSIVTYERR